MLTSLRGTVAGDGPPVSAGRPKGGARRSLRALLYSSRIAPYVFVLPFVLSFLVFFLYPTISTFQMSFQRILGIHDVTYIGMDNYRRLANAHFFNAVLTNTLYTLFTISLLIPLPLFYAVLLNSRMLPGRNAFRSMIFLPSLVSVIVAGVAFRLLFGDSEYTFANMLLIRLGLPPQRWPLTYTTGMFIMVALATWRWSGVNMVYFLSGLQSIPQELYESAEIDGANALQKFRSITLPLLRPIIVYLLTISIYAGYAMFGESYVFWNESLPGDIGLTMVRYIYQEAFQRNDMGFGSAIGITLLALVFTVNLIQLRFFGLFRRE
jgi:arabinosaccharide transport system permease protein